MQPSNKALISYNNLALLNYFNTLTSYDKNIPSDCAPFHEAEHYPLQEGCVKGLNEILSDQQQLERIANRLVDRKIYEIRSKECFLDQRILSKIAVKCEEAIRHPGNQVDYLKNQVSKYIHKLIVKMSLRHLPKDISALIQKISSDSQICLEDIRKLHKISAANHKFQGFLCFQAEPEPDLNELPLIEKICEMLEALSIPLAPKEMLELFQKNLASLNSKMEYLKKTRTDLVPSIDKKGLIPFNSSFNSNVALPIEIIKIIFSCNNPVHCRFINKEIEEWLKTKKMDWIKWINEEEADLSVISPSLADLMCLFTNTQNLDKAMFHFKTVASQIEHLSLSKVTTVRHKSDRLNDKQLDKKIKSSFLTGFGNLKSLTLEDPLFGNLFCYDDVGTLLLRNKKLEKFFCHGFQGNLRCFRSDLQRRADNGGSPFKVFSFSVNQDWKLIAVKDLKRVLRQLGSSSLDALEELHFQVMTLGYFEKIIKFKNLKKLYMDFEFLQRKNELVCEKLKELKECQIKELGIKNLKCHETVNFMASIREALPKLEKITLENIPYFEHYMGELVKLQSLKEIIISEGKMAGAKDWFSKKPLQQLLGSKSLKTLRLETFSKIEESVIQIIREALPDVEVINSVKPEPEEERLGR